jgi:hypothetical protein
MMKTAAAFPSWWIRDKRLKLLGGGASTTGQSIAALKVYLAIAISADELFSEVRTSITQLQVLTGMSRPMLISGIRSLDEIGTLAVDRSGYRSAYKLVQAEGQTHFSKLPRDTVRARLRNLPNATAEALAALKVYLTLLTVRQRNSHLAPISHRRLQAYTAIRPSVIAKGTSILIEHGLVRHSNKEMYRNAEGYLVNTYYLVGTLGENDKKIDTEATNDDPASAITSQEDEGPLEPELPPGESSHGLDAPSRQFTPAQLEKIFADLKID